MIHLLRPMVTANSVRDAPIGLTGKSCRHSGGRRRRTAEQRTRLAEASCPLSCTREGDHRTRMAVKRCQRRPPAENQLAVFGQEVRP